MANAPHEGFWEREVRLFKAEMASWGGAKNQNPKAKKSKKNSTSSQPKQTKKVTKKEASPKIKKVSDHKVGRILANVSLGILFFISFCLLTSAAGVYAYQSRFQTKALYGTKILGQDVGGKNLLEVRNLVAAKTESVSLAFSVEGEKVEVKPVEAGIVFNPDKTAIQALRSGKYGSWYENYYSAAISLATKVSPYLAEKVNHESSNNLALSYTINDQKLGEMTQNLSQSFNVQSKNAGLVMKGGDVQVIPAVYGRQIMTDSVKAQLAESVKTAQTVQIDVEVEKVNPNIVEADTQKSIEAARIMLNTPVKYTYLGKEYVPEKSTVASWIIFNTVKTGGKEQLAPAVDSRLVWPYIYSVGSKINIAAINKKVTVTNGGVQTVSQEGKDGLAVDVDAASVATAKNLTAGKAVSLELPTYTVKAKTTVNNIVVADWAKYIEVDLSAQKMCAYLAGGDLQNCWSITSGATAKGYYTPTGTFLIQRKAGAGGVAGGPGGGGVCMPNPPSKTPLCGINYVSYFTSQGHAIHEAWWRSSFGGNPAYNGSHGCVNATYGIAKWIYEWAPIGTPVIIHY